MPARFSALVVAALSGLRWGELAALRRRDLDLTAAVDRLPRKLSVLKDRVEFGPPKSAAGVRGVVLAAAALEALRLHLAEYVHEDADALVFIGAKGRLLRSSTFGVAVSWQVTVASLGLAGFHFHDLRHTGNTLAASSGASTRELMHRMGHSTMRAALVYQHATSERAHEIASAMDRRIAKQTGKKRGSGKKVGGSARAAANAPTRPTGELLARKIEPAR